MSIPTTHFGTEEQHLTTYYLNHVFSGVFQTRCDNCGRTFTELYLYGLPCRSKWSEKMIKSLDTLDIRDDKQDGEGRLACS
jgi:hypothetical protein